jgi:hypothetical protein
MRRGPPHYSRRKPGSPSIQIPEPGESELQRDVMQLLAWLGVIAESTHNSKSRQPKEYTGRSDISGILPGGRSLRLELKAPGKKPTEEQLAYLERARGQGALAFWADNLSEVRRVVVDAIKRGRRAGAPGRIRPADPESPASPRGAP